MHRNGLDSTKKSYKNDILLILFFLIIGIGAFAFMQLQGKRGAEVKVSVNNKEYAPSIRHPRLTITPAIADFRYRTPLTSQLHGKYQYTGFFQLSQWFFAI